MKTVILNFGYAEDAMISNVIMSTYYLGGGKDFDSVQEGMMSLAMDFYHYHLNFFEKGEVLSVDDFDKSCFYLIKSNSDQASWDEYWHDISLPDPIWSPYWTTETLPDLKSGNFIYIPERAEEVLIDLIWQQNPKAFKEEPKMLNISFSDANLGVAFNVPWQKFKL